MVANKVGGSMIVGIIIGFTIACVLLPAMIAKQMSTNADVHPGPYIHSHQ